MNVFNKSETANNYDNYYQTGFGKQVDEIEKGIISSLIKDIPRDHMLELGCGTGHWSDYFIKQGFKVTGVDISDSMLELAEMKELNAEFLKMDAQFLPYDNESFSVVSAITMIEFVDNQEKVLQEIYRVLKPEGFLILGCLNAKSIIGEKKEQDETFKNANFLTSEELMTKLKFFGQIELDFGVYLTSDFSLLDSTTKREQIEPVFMAAVVKKNIQL